MRRKPRRAGEDQGNEQDLLVRNAAIQQLNNLAAQ